MEAGIELSPQVTLWSVGSICAFARIPFNPALFLQQFPLPFSDLRLLQAVRSLGCRADIRELPAQQIRGVSLPCLAFLKLPSRATGDDAAALTQLDSAVSALVIAADTTRVMYFECGSEKPLTIAVDEFRLRYTGRVLLFQKNVEQSIEETASAPVSASTSEAPIARRFGFRWFVPELLKHKSVWRDVLLASLAIQLMALATPLFTQVVIDKVVVHQTQSTLTVIGIALAVFMVFTAAMSWVRQYLVIHTGNRVDAVLGSQVFAHLVSLPVRYFEQRPTGVIAARLHAVETIREFVAGAAVTLMLDIPFLVVFLGIMFHYSVRLTMLSLAILGAIVLLSLAVTPVFRRRLNQQFLLGARNQAFLTEYIAGIETVKSLQMEPQLNERYGGYLAHYLNAGFRTRSLANTYNTLANGCEQVMTLAILWVGAMLVMAPPAKGEAPFTIGMLVAFQMFAGRLSQPLLRLVGLWQQFQESNIAVQRLGDILNVPTEPYALTPSREHTKRGQIEFRHVAFRYAEHLPYLYRDLNFTLTPGRCVALIGPSGGGKSTLAKLMQGFYLPSDGQILADGRDIRHLSANELRHLFGVVPQETILFAGTVYDNLILANPQVTFEQVMAVCKLAEIHDTIEQLPKGYQTELGERGVGLSGGQKQRLAIARALLKGPKVLIFDEATSGLDATTAEHLAKTINSFKGKVTTLFIAHHLPKGLAIDEVIQLNPTASGEKHMSVVS